MSVFMNKYNPNTVLQVDLGELTKLFIKEKRFTFSMFVSNVCYIYDLLIEDEHFIHTYVSYHFIFFGH